MKLDPSKNKYQTAIYKILSMVVFIVSRSLLKKR